MVDKMATYAKMKDLYPFTQNFTTSQHKLFMDNMVIRHYQPGAVLIEEGFSCNSVFFALEGSIRIFKLSEEGREITLYRINRGDLCLMTTYCIMSDTEFPAIARVEQEAEVIAVSANIFQKLMAEIPNLQKFIFSSSLRRLTDVVQVVESITFTSLRRRIAKFLIILSNRQNSHSLKVTHEEIALEIGTAREAVSRTLKDLQSEGIVKLARGNVQIVSMDLLKQTCFCD